MTTTPQPDDWRTEATADLFTVILSLKTVDEAADFFRDLCTRRELEEMSRRWKVVRMLAEEIPYRRIATETGVSTATITRINQWLRHGRGGYAAALSRMGFKPKAPE